MRSAPGGKAGSALTTPVARTVPELRATVAGWRREGARVAVVPTMGALHEGHLSLVRAAGAGAGRVIVTIFVNPRQFNSPSDLAAYPRHEERDLALLAPLAPDLVYLPGVAEMYPEGFATSVQVRGLGEGLCGAHRAGHFDGVATVVSKLLLQTSADLAYFGEKDFQQVQIVRRAVRDLDIPVEIVACPTVRDPDGLAMSSRNARLSRAERRTAPLLARTLFAAAEAIEAGAGVAASLDAAGKAVLAGGFRELDYLELRAVETLEPLAQLDRPARLLAAAWLGDVRLIDNVPVTPRAGPANA
jgi:pantoate--beta-alanine ligase